MEQRHWPQSLSLVRHAESAGNVAREEAEEAGHQLIDIPTRDMDVPLSERGQRQAAALGRWIGAQPASEQPTVMMTSPYIRAQETAKLALRAAGGALASLPVVVDERLRERELGVLDRLTSSGIKERFPQEAAARGRLGKFYHRPAGGESWADVILRLRSVIQDLPREYAGERVVVVTHQAVILMFRYVLEQMTEQQVLQVDRENEIANCSVTAYTLVPVDGRRGHLELASFNDVSPVESLGEQVTEEPEEEKRAGA